MKLGKQELVYLLEITESMFKQRHSPLRTPRAIEVIVPRVGLFGFAIWRLHGNYVKAQEIK
jgi:hypothetical protein